MPAHVRCALNLLERFGVGALWRFSRDIQGTNTFSRFHRTPPRVAERLPNAASAGAGSRREESDSQIASTLAEHLGDEALTPREVQVLRLVAQGNRNKQVRRGYVPPMRR